MIPRVLIVDDEPHIRLLLQQSLEELEEDEKIELLIAQDGEEALETIQSEKPRLVFLDVMMPKMNGFQVCNEVKNILKIADIYIIMLTAKGQEVDRQQAVNVGADLYLTKPFDPDEVLEKAKEVLGL